MSDEQQELLTEFLAILDRLGETYAPDQAGFEADELGRLAIQQLWIALGETARRYVAATGLSAGTSPWSEVIAHRDKLAHLLRHEVNPELLWNARTELDRFIDQARSELHRRGDYEAR